MDYREWESTVPDAMKIDSVWKVTAYRYSLFMSDLCWRDISLLMKDRRTVSSADQLYRAVCSVGANIAEGYSRSTARDRALFYQYALSSARESRDWYYKSRRVLGMETFGARVDLISQIVRLLVKMISQQRGSLVREDAQDYRVD